MICEVLHYPDTRLVEKSKPIEKVTEEIKELAEAMVETMYKEEGIGLAAPQVGALHRLVVVDVSGPEVRNELMTLVNPEIITADGSCDSEEGCLSVPGYRAKVKRSETVTVKAQDLEGNDVTIEADGLLAICLQHEIDHLDGVLFIDKISRLKRSMYDKKVKKWMKR
ncbi:peptide deformylase [Halodesulfovibrio marinisediminis]|uniref:Peptide deformylase n=1 Tax=Halodesulfovibrio marinisediminis DSM 17456 TaxID=1121457 RepID=A0A1N6EVU4_9BACT|nr:peptide deformylase [Halodesulfovibrio marinisediminis]SIN87071.1 peptide deformylase [Halodesulfovibrio marinisediminis DSM 17456]